MVFEFLRNKEWLGDVSGYIVPVLGGGAGLVAEELTNNMVQAALGLTGTKALIYKNIHRVVFSALYYFGGKSLGRPQVGVVASAMPLALTVVDGISYLLKATPEQAGRALGLRLRSGLWRAGAKASAGIRQVASSRPSEQSVSKVPASAKPAEVL